MQISICIMLKSVNVLEGFWCECKSCRAVGVGGGGGEWGLWFISGYGTKCICQ